MCGPIGFVEAGVVGGKAAELRERTVVLAHDRFGEKPRDLQNSATKLQLRVEPVQVGA